MDAALRARGVQLILDDPGRYLRLSLSRIPVQFQFWPTAESSLAANAARLLSFGLALPFVLGGMALFVRRSLEHVGRRRFWRRGAPWSDADRRAAEGWLLLGIIVVYNVLHPYPDLGQGALPPADGCVYAAVCRTIDCGIRIADCGLAERSEGRGGEERGGEGARGRGASAE
jgi:hypothetical protein